jgi:hypothetical protein
MLLTGLLVFVEFFFVSACADSERRSLAEYKSLSDGYRKASSEF